MSETKKEKELKPEVKTEEKIEEKIEEKKPEDKAEGKTVVKPEKKQDKAKSKGKSSAPKEYKYHENIVATCACGAEFKTGSTLEKIRVDICSHCHPLFTGEKRVMDTEGRIEKFKKKYNLKK